MGNTRNYLDLTRWGVKGPGRGSPNRHPQTPPHDWWIWHDDPSVTVPDRPGLVQLRASQTTAASPNWAAVCFLSRPRHQTSGASGSPRIDGVHGRLMSSVAIPFAPPS